MTCLCRGQCWNGVRFGGVLSGEWNGCPITHKCRHCPHGIYSPVIADRLHFKSLPDCEFWRLMWEVVQRAVDHQVSPRGGGGRPLGSGRQLPPPNNCWPEAPGGGGGGHWRGVSGRGDFGGGAPGGSVGGGGVQVGLPLPPLTSPCPPLALCPYHHHNPNLCSHVDWAEQDPPNFVHGCFCHIIALHFGPQHSL